MLPAILAAGVAAGQMAGSLYGASQDRAAQEALQKNKQRALNTALAQSNTQYDKMLDLLNQYNTNRIKLADNDTVAEYQNLINSYNPEDYTYDFDKFSYDKSVDDFMNPEAEKIAELAGLKTQAQMAGQGAAKGTGALANMGYSRWEAARDLYKDAQNTYNTERNQAYREYSDYITNMQNKLNAINTNTMNKMNLLGGAVQNEQQSQSDYMSDLLSILGDRASTNVNATVGAF